MSWHLEQGLIITDTPILSREPVCRCLQEFVSREQAYRQRFLQKKYGYAFDGYSYYGQEDSTHQAPDDLLHTFVFSDFFPVEKYPVEFQSYIAGSWPLLKPNLLGIETQILRSLPDRVAGLYREHMGHMMTANCYPPLAEFERAAEGNTRLSEHPDVSLFTVFPFGMDEDFEFQDSDGEWHSAPDTGTMVAFPGYLLEWLSHGDIKALNHRVRLSANREQARYSFGVFSIPGRDAVLSRPLASTPDQFEHLSAQSYFEQYLSMWDY